MLCAIVFAAAPEVSAISTHPTLLSTAAGVELARQRVKQERWARQIAGHLAKQADSLAREDLPVFEKDWWDQAKEKHWTQIYPEINYHTNFAVAGPAMKALDAAMAYVLTGRPDYAQTVRRTLLHYTGYEFFAEHPDVGLNWSVWCTRLLCAYDFVYDALTDQDRAKIDDFFKRAMEAVRKSDEWWIRENPGGLFNNHFAWHKFFIGSYGLFYDDPDLVDYAIHSDQGVKELIERGSRDDGLWLESSINYHFTAVIALAEVARQLGNSAHPLDLWHHRFANGRSLEKLLTGPIATLFPDETIPTIGDTYGRRIKLGNTNLYFAAYDAYQRPEIAWILRDRTNPPPDALFLRHLPAASARPPEMRTRLWPEHGYIALRAEEGAGYWRGDGYSVFLSCDADGIHSHHDKFDLIAFGRGAHIAIDPEALSTAQHAFSSSIQNELNHSTVCHNTVMVDRAEHNRIGTRLELVDFVDTSDIKMATIADTQGIVYPGVKMARTVAATSAFVLDIFQVSSDKQHTYDYLFHTPDDKGALAAEGPFESFHLGDAPPWKWLRNGRRQSVDGDWQVTASQGKLKTRLMMTGEPGTQLITCEFPYKDDFSGTPVPMLIARRKAKSTVFVSVLQAERADLPDTQVSVKQERHGFLRVTVTCDGISREFTVKRL